MDDERVSLLSEHSQSSNHGSFDTEIGVTDVYPGPTSPTKKKERFGKRWISIYIMYFTMFISSISFSIVVSPMFPFLEELTSDRATTLEFGIVIAAFSCGQFIGSPIFGMWSDKRPVKEPLFVSLILCVVTNLLYCYTQAFPTTIAKLVILIGARFLVGVAGGNVAIARSYVSGATTQSERVGAFAGISASQAVGFVIGPVLGLAFVRLRSHGYQDPPYYYFNMYTGPGFLSALLAVINIILLFIFKDSRLKKPEEKKMKPVDRSEAFIINSTHSDVSAPTRAIYDRLGTFICCVLFFACLFMFAIFETIIIPYSMDEFAWTKHQGVLYNNIMFGAMSVVSVSTFLIVRIISKYIDERVLFVFGLIVSAIGFFVLMPMGNDKPDVEIEFIESNLSYFHNSSLIPLDHSTIPVGCRYDKLSWCLDLPKLTYYQYGLGMVLLSYGYCSSTLTCYSIFSKIIGPNPQGVMMGILTATGSSARIVGPLFVTYLYDIAGPQVAFASVIAILFAATLLLVGTWYRLVPFGTPRGCPRICIRKK